MGYLFTGLLGLYHASGSFPDSIVPLAVTIDFIALSQKSLRAALAAAGRA
jgi:hypothetical protein